MPVSCQMQQGGCTDARYHRHRAHPLDDARSPQEFNAHPHLSGHDIAVVHNGIMEKHAQLRRELEDRIAEPIDPILFTVPLQLLACHVVILKGTDVDKPRNPVKSVTVE